MAAGPPESDPATHPNNFMKIIRYLDSEGNLRWGSEQPDGGGMAAVPPRWLVPGDSVTIEIDRIGALTNPVAWEY